SDLVLVGLPQYGHCTRPTKQAWFARTGKTSSPAARPGEDVRECDLCDRMTTNDELDRLYKDILNDQHAMEAACVKTEDELRALDKEELASRLESAADLQTQRPYLLDYAKTVRKTIPISMEMLRELIASTHGRLILNRMPSEDISDRVFDALWPEVEGEFS